MTFLWPERASQDPGGRGESPLGSEDPHEGSAEGVREVYPKESAGNEPVRKAVEEGWEGLLEEELYLKFKEDCGERYCHQEQ